MTIEYGNSELTHARRAYIAIRQNRRLRPPDSYYWEQVSDILCHAFCAFVAFRYGNSPIIYFSGLFLTLWTFMLICKFRSYDSWLQLVCFPGHLKSDQKRIRLEIAEDGLREYQGDIVSFASWKDVSGTAIDSDLLIITLSSGQEAIIPRVSFGISELNLEEVRSEIDRRCIKL